VWHFKLGANPRFDRWTLRDLSGKVLREYSATAYTWGLEKDYIYRGGMLVGAETSEGQRHFHLDHLGTPRLITDGNGDQATYHVYYPFGEEATDPYQDQERMKFTGHERDLGNPEATGDDLDYMFARLCSPLTGRFLSTDPKVALKRALKRPQAWNRYSYVIGSP
jgi:RHS repeat-associated protein